MKTLITMVLLTATVAACSTKAGEKDAVIAAQENTISEMRRADSLEQAAAVSAAAPGQTTVVVRDHTASGGTVTHSTATTTSEPAEPVKTRKKLNNTAKGIILGLGAGAITGAAVDKNNRGKGAIIGAAVGAAAGGATGAVIDHKKKTQE